MTHTLTDLENAQRYAKLAARLLEKAAEAHARGEQSLTESRVENAKSFLERATRALTDSPTGEGPFVSMLDSLREQVGVDEADRIAENIKRKLFL